jgi:hypothetical protein
MGIVEQTTGKAINGLLLMAGVIVLAAVCAVRLRHGSERNSRDAVQDQHIAVPAAAEPALSDGA